MTLKGTLGTVLGQGLVESLLVVLLISISVVVLVNFQHYVSYSTNLTQQQIDANTLAVKEIETLYDFQVLTATSGYIAYSSIVSSTGTATVGNTTYTITWTVTPFTNPTYKTLNVTVSWTDRTGTARSIQLVSNVAGLDPGLSGSFM
jgi:hypothetical protein